MMRQLVFFFSFLIILPLSSQEPVKVDLFTGEEGTIKLPGLIWTYIPPKTGLPSGVSFKRSFSDNGTQFVFVFENSGDYLLKFSRQIPDTGELLHASFFASVEERSPAPEKEEVIPVSNASAEEVQSIDTILKGSDALENISDVPSSNDEFDIPDLAGEVDESINGFLERDDPLSALTVLTQWNEVISDKQRQNVAQALFEDFHYEEAAVAWKKNLDSTDKPLSDAALWGRFRSGVAINDKTMVAETLQQLINNGEELSEEELNASYELLVDETDISSLLTIIMEKLIALYPDAEKAPRRLLTLAGNFEAPGERQNLKEAFSLYQMIENTYPASEEAITARTRLDYLKRHYFTVR